MLCGQGWVLALGRGRRRARGGGRGGPSLRASACPGRGACAAPPEAVAAGRSEAGVGAAQSTGRAPRAVTVLAAGSSGGASRLRRRGSFPGVAGSVRAVRFHALDAARRARGITTVPVGSGRRRPRPGRPQLGVRCGPRWRLAEARPPGSSGLSSVGGERGPLSLPTSSTPNRPQGPPFTWGHPGARNFARDCGGSATFRPGHGRGTDPDGITRVLRRPQARPAHGGRTALHVPRAPVGLPSPRIHGGRLTRWGTRWK